MPVKSRSERRMAKALKAPGTVVGSRLTVRLPHRMIDEVKTDMAENSYGPRQQSKWISEAIDGLVDIEYYPVLIAEDYIAEGQNRPVRISVPGSTYAKLQRAIRRVKREQKIDDVLSKLIRTAIIQRLIVAEADKEGKVGRQDRKGGGRG